MSALLFYLCRNASVYEKLTQEIRSTFTHVDQIQSGNLLQSCRYLAACIKETLRVCPSTPGAPWREVEEGGADVDGEHIPKGYDVGTYVFHSDISVVRMNF
jgi:cytochrome P450